MVGLVMNNMLNAISIDEVEADIDVLKDDTCKSSKNSCEYCKSNKSIFIFNCKRCGMQLCVEHRIPELHNCVSVSWKFTKNYTKHFLNDFKIPESNQIQEPD
jgi:hypothetical protein